MDELTFADVVNLRIEAEKKITAILSNLEADTKKRVKDISITEKDITMRGPREIIRDATIELEEFSERRWRGE